MKAGPVLGVICLLLGTASVVGGLALGARVDRPLNAGTAAAAAEPIPTLEATATPEPTPIPTPTPTTTPATRSFAGLQAQVQSLLASAGAEGGGSLVVLGGGGTSWSLDGDMSFVGARTCKLPLLMEDAQDVAAGTAKPTDTLCYEPGDWEDGWFSDYAPGACFTRAELEHRVGMYSDNTAAHILVRENGGGDALNAYARTHGATESEFWEPNVTTSSDLARLWQDEAAGRAGGAPAQRYLYPLLSNTAYGEGIPAGVPSGTTVVHKVGILDGEINDAGLILNGPRGAYVLTVLTENGSWSLIADVARAVAQFGAS